MSVVSLAESKPRSTWVHGELKARAWADESAPSPQGLRERGESGCQRRPVVLKASSLGKLISKGSDWSRANWVGVFNLLSAISVLPQGTSLSPRGLRCSA